MEEKEQLFTCMRGDLTIRGMQYLPVGFVPHNQYPAVIVSHGFTGNYLTMTGYCREFAKMGYIAFSFNFCGGGRLMEDDSLKSDGMTTDMTILTEVEDLVAVKDYVRGLEYVDDKHLVLAGVSQGGFVSGLTAARCSEEIEKLIMVCPALCIPDDARRGRLGGANYDPLKVPEQIDCGRTILGRRFHDEAASMDPYLELSGYQGPVLLLHGTQDMVVNYSYAIRAKESYQNNQCHLQLIRNAGHGFDDNQQESVYASIRQFINDRVEVLTICVIITNHECMVNLEDTTSKIYFTGYCETKYFQGAILPGGCDTQERHLEEKAKIRAEYTLTGLDEAGEKCFIHIVNQWGEIDWKPVIDTDSSALSWLNQADLTAVLEHGNGGPTVRIFAKRLEAERDIK